MAIVKLETGEELEFDNSYSDQQISQAVEEYLGQKQPNQQQNQSVQPRQGATFFEENITRPVLRAGKSIVSSTAGLADVANMAAELPLYLGDRAVQYGKQAITGQEVKPYEPIFMGADVAETTRRAFDEGTDGLTANRNKLEQFLELPQEIAGGFISPAAIASGSRALVQGTKELGKKAIQNISGVKPELVNAFQEAGITPRLADVSTSKPAKAFQNLLEVYPGGASTIKKATDKQILDIENQLAGLTKSRGGTQQETGKVIQQGAEQFKEFANNIVDQRYKDLDKYILAESQRKTYPELGKAIDEWTKLKELQSELTGSVKGNARAGAMFNESANQKLGFFQTRERAQGSPFMSTAAEDAKNLANINKQITNQEKTISKYEKYLSPQQMQSLLMSGQQKIPVNNLRSISNAPEIQDVAAVGSGETAKVINRINQLVDESGNISYPRLKIFRTTIGKKLSSPTLAGDERSSLKQIYGALSEDMKQAVIANGGEKGLEAFNRANNTFKRSQEFLEANITPLIEAKTPEDVYDLALRGSKQGGSRIKPIMSVLNPTQKDFVRGSILKRMGLQKSGLQDDTGEVFSPNKFLTEWDNLSPEARRNIFTPDQVKSVDLLNKAISNIKETSKIANKSNNIPALSWLGLIGTAAISPVSMTQAAGSVVGARISAELFTNPDFMKWLAKAPSVAPKDMPKYISGLSVIAAANPLIQEDVLDYLTSITQANAANPNSADYAQLARNDFNQARETRYEPTEEDIARRAEVRKRQAIKELINRYEKEGKTLKQIPDDEELKRILRM